MKFRGLCLFLQNKFQILQNLGVATNQKVAGSNPSSRTKKNPCNPNGLQGFLLYPEKGQKFQIMVLGQLLGQQTRESH